MKRVLIVQIQKSLLIYIKKYHGVAGLALTRTILITSKFLRWVLFGLSALLSGSAELRARAHLARISLAYHVLGDGPESWRSRFQTPPDIPKP